jgi:hypothetical protein
MSITQMHLTRGATPSPHPLPHMRGGEDHGREAFLQREEAGFLRPLSVVMPRAGAYEQPLVEPQVSHFRQVPLRTMVKLPHSEQLSPS